MDCCGLSSTGLKNVDANDITSDNITIFSFLNVSGVSKFNEAIIYNEALTLKGAAIDETGVYVLKINGNPSTLFIWFG